MKENKALFNYLFHKIQGLLCPVCPRQPWLSSSQSSHNLPHLSTISRQYHTSAVNHCICLHLLMHFSINHSALYNMDQVRYTTKQHVCLVQLYFKCGSARKCHKKFQCKFSGEPVPSKQNIHYLIKKLKATGSLFDKKAR
jgi:hypothetical protein